MSHKRRSFNLEDVVVAADAARFRAKVGRGAADACWPWLACIDRSGYGQFTVMSVGAQPKQLRLGAHVAAYFIATGVDPLGKEVCHRCDNPVCCNPDHLFLGTRKENMQDAARKGRLSTPRPSRHRMTAEQVRWVRERVNAGERRYRLASEFGVSGAYIGLLMKGKRRQYDAPLEKGTSHV